jgi:hypothetical protein
MWRHSWFKTHKKPMWWCSKYDSDTKSGLRFQRSQPTTAKWHRLIISLSFGILFRLLRLKLDLNVSAINITNTLECIYFSQTNLLFYVNFFNHWLTWIKIAGYICPSSPDTLLVFGHKSAYFRTYFKNKSVLETLQLGGAMPNLFSKRIGLAPKMGIFYSTPYLDTLAH